MNQVRRAGRRAGWWCAAAGAALVMAVTIRAQVPGAADTPPGSSVASESTLLDTPEIQADPATPVFRRTCVLCHTPDRVMASRRTGLEWGEIIDKMVTKGARASDDDLQTIFFFLVSHFGKVNINTAPADEIGAVLGVTPDVAQAIVASRDKAGRFDTIDSLSRVPGLAVAKVKPEAVVFN
jgi:competence ComEA-like helix-hairpin-helix protein